MFKKNKEETIKLTEHQIRKIWTNGFNSGSGISKTAVSDLLKNAQYDPGTISYHVTEESISNVRDKLMDGYSTHMRIGTREGLDFYFAYANGGVDPIMKGVYE